MTGFDSKRQAAQAKVQEEMQVIFTQRQAERDKLQDEPDMLLIVYQRGFADGKKAQRKPLTDEMKTRCPYTAVSERGAFYDGWLSAEAAHNIKEGT
jgi:ribosome modulation factor